MSGGQTGADRAALDVALALGLGAGGWCPAGRWAEDGPIPPRYPLHETPTADPAERTAWNVRDSDATLILSPRPLTGGTALTLRLAHEQERPVHIADPFVDGVPPASRWIRTVLGSGGTLNVAGPRESECPGIQAASAAWLRQLLAPLAESEAE